MEIVGLSKRPEVIPEISKWMEKEFKHLLPEYTAKDYELYFKERLDEKKMPVTFIAIEGDRVVGTVSLREYVDNSPWRKPGDS